MECPVCLNPFNNSLSLPMILKCGHSVCAPCLNDIYNSENKICPLDRNELPSQNENAPNYALIESLQRRTLSGDVLLCCNGHALDELISTKSRCRICKKDKSPMWFCIPCQSGVCDKCKEWHNSSQPISESSIKCYKGHGLRLTNNPAKFYDRKGMFLCDGCREKDAGASAHCRKCNVDFCTKCIRKITELVSFSLQLKCSCSKQVVWRAQTLCAKCSGCRNKFEKSGCFLCVACQKRFCLTCAYKKILG